MTLTLLLAIAVTAAGCGGGAQTSANGSADEMRMPGDSSGESERGVNEPGSGTDDSGSNNPQDGISGSDSGSGTVETVEPPSEDSSVMNEEDENTGWTLE